MEVIKGEDLLEGKAEKKKMDSGHEEGGGRWGGQYRGDKIRN